MARQTTVADKIRTEDEFRTLLDTLCADLAQAHDHYTLFQRLLAAKEGAYTKAVSQSQTFWSLTYGAHYDAAVFRLCRAYDQDSDALSLRTLLETIALAPPFLTSPRRSIAPGDVARDLTLVSHETNPVVKHLMIWRHKVYSHRDVEKTLVGGMAVDYPVTHDEVTALLDDGFKMLNRYNVTFFGTAFASEMSGNTDYLKVLQTLQDAHDAKIAAFQADIERLRSE